MTTFIATVILCFWITFCGAQNRSYAEENINYVHIIQNIDHGGDKFPYTVNIEFEHGGDRHVFQLARDDVTTGLLSESVFDVSRTLPSDVYKDEDRENFAAYSIANDESNLVLHRETNTSPVKVYGGFTRNGERLVVRAVENQPHLHRVIRETELHTRPKRSTNYFETSYGDGPSDYSINSTDKVIELFLFGDLALFNHFVDNGLATGTLSDKKLAVRNYLRAITRDVDVIFQEAGSPGLRVYFMEYQIITQQSHQDGWTNGNLVGNTLDPLALDAFIAYYDNLVTKFAFPDPDHLMLITRYQLSGNEMVWSTNMCSSNRSASMVGRVDDTVKAMAIVLLSSMGGTFDDDTACSPSNAYVAANTFGQEATAQGNAWRFSSCSLAVINSVVNNGSNGYACLQQSSVDIFYDFSTFTNVSYVGQTYSASEQCVVYHGSNYTFNGTADCYSGSELCVDTTGGGADQFIRLGQLTPCIGGEMCNLGFCDARTTTTAPTTTTASGEGGETTDTHIMPPSSLMPSTRTPRPDCVQELDSVDVELPGCGCCGVCGCDDTCDECRKPVPSESFVNDTCMPEKDCCPGKLQLTTMFVPYGCPANINPGPQTLVIDQRGWDDIDVHAWAIVKPRQGEYSVRLVESY